MWHNIVSWVDSDILKDHIAFFITFRRQALKEKPTVRPLKEKHYNLLKHGMYEHRSNSRFSHPTGLEYTNALMFIGPYIILIVE